LPEATASVDPKTQKTTLFMTPPNPATAGFNALTFDKKGNVYVSDSFQGIIWQTGPGGSTPTKWYSPTNQNDLLLPTPNDRQPLIPPFGANGIEFNNGISHDGSIEGLLFPASPSFSPNGKVLYVTNLALFLPFAGVPEIAVVSGWTLQVKHYNIPKIELEDSD
jgi:sugar lactone lactonase YvrE